MCSIPEGHYTCELSANRRKKLLLHVRIKLQNPNQKFTIYTFYLAMSGLDSLGSGRDD
jgi:hypothetical protein